MVGLTETPVKVKRSRKSEPGSTTKAAKFEQENARPNEEDYFGDSEGESDAAIPSDAEIDEYDTLGCPRRWTPNQLRTKIRALLNKTDIKVTEFHRMLSVNGNSYSKFMTFKYKDQWSAAENGTYDAATRFFLKEERLGKNALGKVRAIASKAKSENKLVLPDINGVTTDGKTWVTPGETRTEIGKLCKQFETSVAALSRLAGVSQQNFNLFYKATGDFGRRESGAYRPAADLVEKFRIAMKKPKSKKRLALEAEFHAGRMDHDGQPFLGHDVPGNILCVAGERPFLARDDIGRKVVKFR